MKKQIFSAIVLIMFFLLFGNVVLADNTAKAILGYKEENGKLRISASIEDNPGIAAMIFRVKWDSDLLRFETDSLEFQGDFSSGNSVYRLVNDKEILINWFAMKNIKTNGEMFSLVLCPTMEKASFETVIELSCSQENTINMDEQIVPISTEDVRVKFGNGIADIESTAMPKDPLFENHDFSLIVGETKQIKTSYKNLIWTCENDLLVSVDNSGIVKGLKPGRTTVSAFTQDGQLQDVCVVIVSENIVTSVESEVDEVPFIDTTAIEIEESKVESSTEIVESEEKSGDIKDTEKSDARWWVVIPLLTVILAVIVIIAVKRKGIAER